MHRLATAVWKRAGGYLQWRVLWLRHATFMIGVTGAVLDDQGRALLLRHEYWTGCPWGLPSGYAERGETVGETLTREVMEEAGIAVRDVSVGWVRSGFRFRIEVYCLASVTGSPVPRVDGREVSEARFVAADEVPADLREEHLRLLRHAWALRAES